MLQVLSSKKLAIWWIVANAVGWAVTMGAFETLPDGFKPFACVIMATAQWLALRSQLRVSPLWMLGTSLAWFAGLWVAVATLDFVGPDPLKTGAAGGVLAGILQSWTWSRSASWPKIWLPVTIVASVAGWCAGLTMGLHVGSESFQTYVIAGAAGGLVIGLVSAPALVWLLTHPKTTSPPKSVGDQQWKRFYVNPPQ